MGEIKFRVWSKKYNKIFQVKVLDLYCNETFVEHLDLGNIFLNIKNVKLMQYTGLKDKNGVEIYEKDYVLKNNKKYLVEFIYNKYILKDISNNDIIELDNNCEVINNFYEN